MGAEFKSKKKRMNAVTFWNSHPPSPRNVRFCVSSQSHVMAGDQLVHSSFLQSLSSLAVGLNLEQLLSSEPAPPHHDAAAVSSTRSEWSWLSTFSTTVKTAEAFARSASFPEEFTVPELLQNAEAASSKALVSESDRKRGANSCVLKTMERFEFSVSQVSLTLETPSTEEDRKHYYFKDYF